jgi:predicted 2-oxoglutarate/Fe(II)-dependent dioxygenase YbiX
LILIYVPDVLSNADVADFRRAMDAADWEDATFANIEDNSPARMLRTVTIAVVAISFSRGRTAALQAIVSSGISLSIVFS